MIERALRKFANQHQDAVLLSTGSTVVSFGEVLYNVVGSTDDPDIDGLSWKQLLIRNGIDGDCYVTAPLPNRTGTSHPGFDVGGHMTPNADGHVPNGGVCYLMPLCKWHNSTRRDGIPFEHEKTKMLKLTGYMEGDLAMTFAARLPGNAPYRLVSFENDALAPSAVSAPQLDLLNSRRERAVLPRNFLLFRRVQEGGEERFVIEDSRFERL